MKRDARSPQPIGAEDRLIRRVATGLFILAAVFALYDTVTLIRYGADLNRHLPFLLPVALACYGFACLKMLRNRKQSDGTAPRAGEYDRQSYLHPGNHPKGRRDAPDGTSD